ncbi:MAG: fused MFS/spermidine synthase [Planctomycetes bacterium]|nr:fused MFS/spermidine synthase [Planctomycetota bacterium]
MNETKTEQKAFPPSVVSGATIFLASVCVMMVEIVAGRLAARHIGSSLYTWTAVIGVILGGITLGYYIGGRLADSLPARKTISWLLAASSGACIAIIILNNLVGEWTFLWRMEMAQRVLCHITIVFFIPSMLMGAISPVAVKIALESRQDSGRTVGRMYALGAAGSILGTFLAGFWLIGTIGTVNTLWLTTGIMLVMALMYLPRSGAMLAYAAVVVLLAIAGTMPAKWAQDVGSAMSLRQTHKPDMLYETESQYGYVAVQQLSEEPDERQFVQDNLKSHSQIIMGRIRDLRFFYVRVYGAVTRRAAAGKEKLCTLSIGGGGYVFPRYILDLWPGSQVDVVEIDPAVTEAAKQAFGLPRDTPIRTINLDGRNYVDELLEKKRRGEQIPQYDFIYMDAFNDLSVPFQLVTRQFNEKIFAITAADGVYITNLIDMRDSGKFIASFVATVKETFPYIYVVTRQSSYDLPANFIVIAGKRPVNLENLNTEENLAGAQLIIRDENDLTAFQNKVDWIVLDDDYVPVENFMTPVVRGISSVTIAAKYIKQAEELNSAGKWEEALEKYRMVAKICPSLSAKANFLMWKILADHNKWQEVVGVLGSVLAENDIKANKPFTAMLHYYLGIALNKTSDTEGASRQFEEAIKLLQADLSEKGDSAQTYSHLGQVYSAINNTKDANLCFERAKQLREDKPK